MPFCKTCGSYYTKSLGVCPKCNAQQLLAEQPVPSDPDPEEAARARKRSWVGLIIGVPAFIAFIYLLSYLRVLISK